MKFYSTIILLALIAYINNEDCDNISNPSKKKIVMVNFLTPKRKMDIPIAVLLILKKAKDAYQ